MRCLDKQCIGRSDRQARVRWLVLEQAYRCIACGGIVATDVDLAARARVTAASAHPSPPGVP